MHTHTRAHTQNTATKRGLKEDEGRNALILRERVLINARTLAKTVATMGDAERLRR